MRSGPVAWCVGADGGAACTATPPGPMSGRLVLVSVLVVPVVLMGLMVLERNLVR